jgi:hypothetical protein
MIYLVHLLFDVVLLATIMIIFRELRSLRAQTHQLAWDVDQLASRILLMTLNPQDAEPVKQFSAAILQFSREAGKRGK